MKKLLNLLLVIVMLAVFVPTTLAAPRTGRGSSALTWAGHLTVPKRLFL
jgi:hypothetical protein